MTRQEALAIAKPILKYPNDLSNYKFGRLKPLFKYGTTNNGKHGSKSLWLCKCDCGKEKIILRNSLISGNTQSCGCLETEIKISSHIKHSMSRTRLYKIWCCMKYRCHNKNNSDYPYYGGRGIKVCDEWQQDFKIFSDWAIKNGYNEKLTIDRIDVNGNYSPNNCRWTTRKEQTRNRNITKKIFYNGENISISKIAEIENITYNKAYKKYLRQNNIINI